jgi:RHS repeat-associated protein
MWPIKLKNVQSTIMRNLSLSTIICLCLFSLFCKTTEAQAPANKPNGVSQTPALPGSIVYPDDLAPGKVSYVRTRSAIKPINNISTFNNAPYTEIKTSTDYVDGLGRLRQHVERQQSPAAKDMVTMKVYDQAGRESSQYLPFTMISGSRVDDGGFKTSPFASQTAFHQNTSLNPGLSGESIYHGATEFEPSPLNRELATYAPGNSWVGSMASTTKRAKFKEYLTNIPGDNVRVWHIANNPLMYDVGGDAGTNLPGSPGIYQPGLLFKTVTKDEASKVTVEYADKDGKVVLKKVQIGNIPADYTGHDGFLCTYFVYDDWERLRFVMSPNAIEAIKSNWILTTDVVEGLCFRYEYDRRDRQIAKKMPGAGWVYKVYDNRDREVFSQDANMRQKGQWLATLYDVINRPVMTGIMTYSGSVTTLQSVTTSNTTKPVVPDPPAGTEDHRTFQEERNGTYAAKKSITLLPGFFTTPNIEFSAYIYPDPGAPNYETQVLNGLTINKNPIPAGAGFIALTITYYDNYNWTTKTYTATYNSKLDNVGNNPNAEPLPTQTYLQVSGLVTGTMTRVIEDPDNPGQGSWVTKVNFYDEKGRLVQTQSDSYKGSNETEISRYDYSGKVLCSYTVHQNTTAGSEFVKIKTGTEYDHTGRVKEIWKTINDDETQKVRLVKNEYDESGRLKRKELGSKYDAQTNAYTTTPLETQDYTYNIRGWLKGINKDYANAQVNGPWFGMELNYDWGFDNSQYSGDIAGTKWRTKGNGIQRAYGFQYDRSGRILGCDFSQKNGSSYTDDAIVNFDMVMGDGQDATTAYDANGNIRRMRQWALKLNTNSLIDDLRYTYSANSNKLKNVVDFNNDVQSKLGDFKTATNHPQKSLKDNYVANQVSVDINTIEDYTYDANGNLKKDLNKDLGSSSTDGMVYNFLNLPWKLTFKNGSNNKGTITYIYDATGNKLEKRVHEEAASFNNNQEKNTVTTYLDGFIYEAESPAGSSVVGLPKLSFFNHEEGRTRYVPADGSVPASFQYDYFVKDHLGNTRMVLSSEPRTRLYQAGFETASRSFEVELFGDKVNSTAFTKPSGFDNISSNQQVSRLDGTVAANRVGPGVVLKAMAGDKFKAAVFGWYQPTGMDNSVDPTLANIVTNLLGQLAPGVSGFGKGTANQQITEALLQPGMEDFLDDRTPQSNRPRAYLNWVMLDEEQFKKVENTGGAVQIPEITGVQQKQLLQANNGNEIEIPRNCYLYVYLSNESKGNVYFDDIRIDYYHGPLMEETHYYAFGLTMQGISSKANRKSAENKIKFQGQELAKAEFSDGTGLDMYEFKYRMDDLQIGRFWQVDPLSDKYVYNSTYAFSENHVTAHVELEGLEKYPIHEGERAYISFGRSSKTNQAMLTTERKQQEAPDATIKQTGGGNYKGGTYTETNYNTGKDEKKTAPTPLLNDPRATVTSKYGSEGLQIVQVVIASSLPGGKAPNGIPVQQMTIDGKEKTAFVDGGHKSPSGASISGKPYYNSLMDLMNPNYANATWNRNDSKGSITAFDIPRAAYIHSELRFETYFVLQNYAGTSQDKIVGRIDWGYMTTQKGITPIGIPKLVPTSQFSATASAIIKHDYPDYEPLK